MEYNDNIVIHKQLKIFKRAHQMAELANRLGIAQPRANEILKCKIQNFTIDRLLNYYAILFPGASVDVKSAG